ncbi:MAG: ABC transporter substrate-binding protein [Acidimicrobiia bacterium]
MSRSARGLLVVLAAMSLVAAACGSDDEPAAESTAAPAASVTAAPGDDSETTEAAAETTPETDAPVASAAAPEGTLRVNVAALSSEVLDPKAFLSADQYFYLPIVFDSLFVVDPETGATAPGLATDAEMSDDGLTLTLTLRDGVKFHDGSPFTAEDVKFSIERYIAEGSTAVSAARIKAMIKEITVVDDHTLTITSEAGMPTILADLTMNPGSTSGFVVPKAYVESVGDEEFQRNPIGTGPFKFESHEVGRSMTFTANEDYWGEVPHVAELQLELVADAATRLSNLTAGTTDLVPDVAGPAILQVEGDSNLQTFTTPGAQVAYMIIGGKANPDSPLSNADVRNALSMAIDREGIIESLLFGRAQPAYLFMFPTSFGWPDNGDELTIPYDPDAAKALLETAGFGDGFDIGVVARPSDADPAGAIAQNLTAIGLNAEVTILDPAEWLKNMQDDAAQDSTRISLSALPYRYDITSSMLNHYHSSATTYGQPHSDAELDDWVLKGTTEPNQDKREEFVRQAVTRAFEEDMFLPLWYVDAVFGASSNIESWTPLPGAREPLNLQSVVLAD